MISARGLEWQQMPILISMACIVNNYKEMGIRAMAMDINLDKVNEFFNEYLRERKLPLYAGILWGRIIDTGQIKWALVSSLRDAIVVTDITYAEATTYMSNIVPDFKHRTEICITSPNYAVIREAGFICNNGHYLIRQNDNKLYDICINGVLFKQNVTYIYVIEFVSGINSAC